MNVKELMDELSNAEPDAAVVIFDESIGDNIEVCSIVTGTTQEYINPTNDAVEGRVCVLGT